MNTLDKSKLTEETSEHITKTAQLKGITEEEVMATILNNYARRYANQVESAITAVDRAVQNYK